jgi:glycosyltransferase involved in cell wall biosynthesis
MEMLIRCDMMVHPAICLEVFGLSIAEALSIGRPVIATRCGGAEIQVRDGENGFLVPPNDPAALRMVMQKVIDDRGLLADMAKGTGNVRSIDAHIREMEKIYLECLL